MNSNRIKELLDTTIKNNQNLLEQGRDKITLNIEGHAGIAKTSSVIQYCNKNNYEYAKLNLASIQDLGDLIGYPYKVQKVKDKKTGEVKWLEDKAINKNHELLNEYRTSYAPPSWHEKLTRDTSKPSVLLLDDYTRAVPQVLQACMQIIARGEFYSWELPDNVNIVLTTNPDNGGYNVSFQDAAQNTRFITLEQTFDIDAWAEWAEGYGIDGRFINFMIGYHHEVIAENAEGTSLQTNPRQWVNFFNAIDGIEELDSTEGLKLINSFGKSLGQYKSVFTTFINKDLDKLPPIKELTQGDVESSIEQFKKVVGELGTDDYKNDIAGIIASRFHTYLKSKFEGKSMGNKDCDKLEKIISSDIFNNELKSVIIQGVSKASRTFRKLLTREEIVKHLTN